MRCIPKTQYRILVVLLATCPIGPQSSTETLHRVEITATKMPKINAHIAAATPHTPLAVHWLPVTADVNERSLIAAGNKYTSVDPNVPPTTENTSLACGTCTAITTTTITTAT